MTDLRAAFAFVLAATLIRAATAQALDPQTVRTVAAQTSCVGGRDCDWGESVCRSTNPAGPEGSLAFSDSGRAIRSDSLGSYTNGADGVSVFAAQAAGLVVGPVPPGRPLSRRSVRIDLDHPVPSGTGVRLGLITANANIDINAQWYTEANNTQHSLLDIPVGATVDAQQLSVGFPIDGIAHALQMGPQPWGPSRFAVG